MSCQRVVDRLVDDVCINLYVAIFINCDKLAEVHPTDALLSPIIDVLLFITWSPDSDLKRRGISVNSPFDGLILGVFNLVNNEIQVVNTLVHAPFAGIFKRNMNFSVDQVNTVNSSIS